MVRDTGCCVIHGERVREIAPVHTPVSAPVYNLKIKFYTPTFIKKAVKRAIKRYREKQENLVRLLYPQGVLDQKIRVVQTKLISPT